VTRVITHSRPASSVISTSHTQVVRPRCRARATAVIVPAVIGRRKLVRFDRPIAVLPSATTASAVPLVARLSATAAYTPPWTSPAGCLISSRTGTCPRITPSPASVICRP
jgi:hypothetical protein